MSTFGSQRWHRALLLFLVIFIFAVITQFGVGYYLGRTQVKNSLKSGAKEIARYLAFSKRWNLTRLRQADPKVNSYYVADSSGLNLEIVGYNPALKLQVDLTNQIHGLMTVTVPETGESWRLFEKEINGGTVIVGVSPPEDIKNVDERLQENANRFGFSIETALRVDTSEIEKAIDFAVVDKNNLLRSAFGGVPLRFKFSKVFRPNEVDEIRSDEGVSYGVFIQAVNDSVGRTVGSIYILDELPRPPWLSMHHWIINCLTSAFLAFVVTLVRIPYIGERFDPEKLLHLSLRKGESTTVEFKEALRWDHHLQEINQPDELTKRKPSPSKGEAEKIAVKTVAALLNYRAGGTLLIGVADDKSVVGLDRDYASLVRKGETRGDRNKDRDRFQLHFRHILAPKIGQNISDLYVHTAIIEVEDKDVCVVHASPAGVPVYVDEVIGKKFYVRDGASSASLDVEQVVEYVEQRWPKALWRRGRNALRRS